jgi:hypothetical protein
MCIRRETQGKGSANPRLFPPVSKPCTHITYMLRQCTSIVYLGLITVVKLSIASVLHFMATFKQIRHTE